MQKQFSWNRVVRASLIAVVAIAVLGAIAYAAYRYEILRNTNAALSANNTTMGREITALERSLTAAEATLGTTTQALQTEQNKNGEFESEISQISKTVEIMQKVSETDSQLLEKYSKVYFLNENYVPASLSGIDTQYLYTKARPELILSGVLPDLQGLLGAASRDGVNLQVVSAYRSFYEQTSLKLGYKMTYGAGTANQFSADQGYSEHQLGTAVDLAVAGEKDPFAQFASSSGYPWLTANAYKYGFILSYPPKNGYYVFEPWHWRFVGIALATKLHEENEYFYTMDQRDIDQYLAYFFD